jgi:imidazolonepropionase-like amidohydrolase
MQSDEFAIRAQVLSPAEIIGSATTIGAEILGMTGKLGRLAPGAYADVLVVDGDPLRDLSCLAGQGEHIPLVMKGGRVEFNELH